MSVELQAIELAKQRILFSSEYMHACAIRFGNQWHYHGQNSDRQLYNGACYNEHAETNALSKLIKTRKNKLISVDLLVIRTDKSLGLKNSKPCLKCIEHMAVLPKYGYRIKYVFYSSPSGDIIKTTFNQLYDDKDYHISQRFR